MSDRDELGALLEQLAARVREAYAGRSHAPVVIDQLRGFADRIGVLADGLGANVGASIREIDRCIDAMTGVPAPAAPPDAGPSFGQLESALCSWLRANWRCTPLRVVQGDAPAPPTGDDATYDGYFTTWVLTERDAHPVLLHVTFGRTADNSWSVQRLAVAS